MDLAVIIVTWNVRALVLDALRTLYDDLAASGLSAQVYVVDSASGDGTPGAVAQAFPQVRLTASADNLGFGAANNVGIRQALADGAPVIYLLNPDTLTQRGATRALYDALATRPRAGLVGARLTYGDGSFQHAAFTFPGLRQLWVELFPAPARLYDSAFNGRYSRALYEAGDPFPVDFVLGATMMLRREVVERTGGFDETFFMYCEEIEWAWRIRRAGWDVLCVPAAHVVHLGGQSTGQVRPKSLHNLWVSRLELYRRIHPAWRFTLARWMIAAGMARREPDAALRAVRQTIGQWAWHPARFLIDKTYYHK